MCTCSKGKTSLGVEAASYFFIFSPRKKKNDRIVTVSSSKKIKWNFTLQHWPSGQSVSDSVRPLYSTINFTSPQETVLLKNFHFSHSLKAHTGGEGREGYCSKFWWGRVAPFLANQNMPLSLPTQFEALPKEPPYHFWSQNCRVSRFWVWLQKRACTLVHGQINKSQISRNLLDLYLT